MPKAKFGEKAILIPLINPQTDFELKHISWEACFSFLLLLLRMVKKATLHHHSDLV